MTPGVRLVSIEQPCPSFKGNFIDSTLAKSELKEGSEGGGALLWALFRFFKASLLLNAIPRLMVIAFRYSQPILINRTIRYVTVPATEIEERGATGFHLIVAAFVIYVGSGVSCSLIHCSSLDTDGCNRYLFASTTKTTTESGSRLVALSLASFTLVV